MTFLSRNKRRSFWMLLISFLVVMAVPVTVGIVMYSKFESILIDHAHQNNLVMMQQLQQVSDSRLEEVQIITEKLAYNSRLVALLGSGASIRPSDQYRFVDFIKDLSQTIARSSFISDAYIYIKEGNHILGQSFKTNLNMFYRDITYYPDKSQAEWQSQFFEQRRLRTYFPLQDVVSHSGNTFVKERNVVYVQTLPMDSLNDYKGAVVLHIDEQNFRTMFEQIETLHQQEIYLIDAERNVIIGTRNEMDQTLSGILGQLSASRGQMEAQIDGESHLLSYATSEMNGWTYLLVTPASVVMQSIAPIKHTALGVFVLLIIVGGLLCYWLASRNYLPIRDLVAMISRTKPSAEHSFSNEYDLIKQTMLHAFHSEQHLQEQMSKQRPMLQANFLSRLLQGFVDMDQLDEDSRNFMNLSFPYACYRVTLIQIESGGKFVVSDHEQEWGLVRFLVSNIALEQLVGQGYALELDRQRIAILTSAPSVQTTVEEDGIRSFAEGLQSIISDRFRTTLTLTISTVNTNPAQAYREAVRALDYKIVRGAGGILYYDQLQFDPDVYYFYPMELEAQLVNHVKSGEEEQTMALLDQIYSNNRHNARMTPELARCLYIDIGATLLKTIHLLNVPLHEDIPTQRLTIERLMESETVEDMHAHIRSLFSQVCQHVQTIRSGHHQRMYQELLSYVDGRVCDNSLSHAEVAETFGITPQYLSTFFKKQMGINLSEYITIQRIEHAKRLMRNPDMTLSQIASQVGYANDIGLIRVFKKIEGITPGKYRENMLHELREA